MSANTRPCSPSTRRAACWGTPRSTPGATRWNAAHEGTSTRLLVLSDTVWANIVYGRPNATRQDVEAAAQAAEAHGFIEELPNGTRTLDIVRSFLCGQGRVLTS